MLISALKQLSNFNCNYVEQAKGIYAENSPTSASSPCKNRGFICRYGGIGRRAWFRKIKYADMAELADAHGSGPCESNFMQVQVLLSAPYKSDTLLGVRFIFTIKRIIGLEGERKENSPVDCFPRESYAALWRYTRRSKRGRRFRNNKGMFYPHQKKPDFIGLFAVLGYKKCWQTRKVCS